ncbi:MAG: chloride channel protein [Prevotellaceae bacterium]|jgi:CIC family chloride channel protein|nr:chloride channel protein [Prevotellaceae bacterium]
MEFKLTIPLQLRSYITRQSRRLTDQQLIYLLAFVVGLGSGFAAILLKHTIHLVKEMLTSWFSADTGSFLYLAYPGIGIAITVLFVRYFVKDDIGHGITKALYAISRKESKIRPHNMYSSIVASSFTIGFGGSVGAEAPIVLTGSAIGSNIGQFLRLNYKKITLLLGCGAAGAVAGIFKAPLAGIVFTLEILMLDLTLASIIPLLIASVTATGISYLLMGADVVFSNMTQGFVIGNIPYYIFLGIFCGFVALYFTRATMYLEGRLNEILSPVRKWLIGAVALGVLIFFIPPLYGEGYGILNSLLSQNSGAIFENSIFYGMQNKVWFVLIYLVLILVFKVVAMACTNGSGGVGGTFGPTLFMGGIAGFFIARLINVSGIHQVPETNFALVGMGGMMAAVMHAPLTAIFLIAEITGGYTLFMPLIVVSVVSFITIRGFESHSIYTKRLAKKGDLITHNKDKAVLTLLRVDGLVETNFKTIRPDATLGELVNLISKSKRNLFPVVNKNRKIVGVVLLDDIRDIMFKSSKYSEVHVRDIMVDPPEIVNLDEPMESVVHKFEITKAWNLPVLDEQDHYVGFLSKSNIFSAYRDLLKEFSDE